MYSRLHLQVRVTPQEAEELLCKLVQPIPSLLHDLNRPGELLDYAGRPFIGRVEDGRFKFYRVITGRNSFLPIISGEIVSAEGGAELRGVMRLSLSVAVLMAVALAIWSSLAFNRFPSTVQTGDVEEAILACVILLFFIGLAVLAFLTERRKAMRLLSEAFGTRNG